MTAKDRVRIQFYMTQELHQELSEYAEFYETDDSSAIRRAIRLMIDQDRVQRGALSSGSPRTAPRRT